MRRRPSSAPWPRLASISPSSYATRGRRSMDGPSAEVGVATGVGTGVDTAPLSGGIGPGRVIAGACRPRARAGRPRDRRNTEPFLLNTTTRSCLSGPGPPSPGRAGPRRAAPGRAHVHDTNSTESSNEYIDTKRRAELQCSSEKVRRHRGECGSSGQRRLGRHVGRVALDDADGTLALEVGGDDEDGGAVVLAGRRQHRRVILLEVRDRRAHPLNLVPLAVDREARPAAPRHARLGEPDEDVPVRKRRHDRLHDEANLLARVRLVHPAHREQRLALVAGVAVPRKLEVRGELHAVRRLKLVDARRRVREVGVRCLGLVEPVVGHRAAHLRRRNLVGRTAPIGKLPALCGRGEQRGRPRRVQRRVDRLEHAPALHAAAPSPSPSPSTSMTSGSVVQLFCLPEKSIWIGCGRLRVSSASIRACARSSYGADHHGAGADSEVFSARRGDHGGGVGIGRVGRHPRRRPDHGDSARLATRAVGVIPVRPLWGSQMRISRLTPTGVSSTRSLRLREI